MTAIAAFAGGVIFKKFHFVTALRAFFIKNRPCLPVLGILSGTFHGLKSFRYSRNMRVKFPITSEISAGIHLMP
jgi:hypothetical protein